MLKVSRYTVTVNKEYHVKLGILAAAASILALLCFGANTAGVRAYTGASVVRVPAGLIAGSITTGRSQRWTAPQYNASPQGQPGVANNVVYVARAYLGRIREH